MTDTHSILKQVKKTNESKEIPVWLKACEKVICHW